VTDHKKKAAAEPRTRFERHDFVAALAAWGDRRAPASTTRSLDGSV